MAIISPADGELKTYQQIKGELVEFDGIPVDPPACCDFCVELIRSKASCEANACKASGVVLTVDTFTHCPYPSKKKMPDSKYFKAFELFSNSYVVPDDEEFQRTIKHFFISALKGAGL